MPSARQYAFAATLASFGAASRPSTKIWFSSIYGWPSYGTASTMAGPPVEKRYDAVPCKGLPARSFSAGFKLKLQATPAGKSRSKS